MATIQSLIDRIERLELKVDVLLKLTNTVPMLIKWVIFPLISILGAAYGIKTIITG